MKKCFKRAVLCFTAAVLFWFGGLLADRELLNEELIRLHVVANSDSAADQSLKLLVRDAVTESLAKAMTDASDAEAAKAYLQENLPKIQEVAEKTLREAGCDDTAVVSFAKEAFDTRYYDTFTLPAGVYDALRITIGEGEGKNWWCVVFPTLCIPATTEGFSDVAAGAGFPDTLNGALTGDTGYEIRFYLLDMLGRMENKLFWD